MDFASCSSGPTSGVRHVAICRIERRRLGRLERKKDYKARADDFHRKEKALGALQRKAEERNPDEFYFGMEHSRTRGGVHIKRSVCPDIACTVLTSPTRALSCFACHSGPLRSGVGLCSATQANKYSQEQLQLMKGQDIKYVALKSQAEAKVFQPPYPRVISMLCQECCTVQLQVCYISSSSVGND